MSLPLVAVSPVCQEYGQIEYELQVQLGVPKVVINECFELGNPKSAAQFTSFTKSIADPNIVYVYVPTSSLEQRVTDISENGFKVDPKNGFTFKVGSFEIDRSAEVIELIRLAIALGTPLNFQPLNCNIVEGLFTDDIPTNVNLRSGCHSLCVSAANDYVVFNSAQVKTCQLIRIKGGDGLKPISEEENQCDLCGKPAMIWCLNDSAKLCESCDTQSHTGNKMFAKHKRIPLAQARSIMETCPIHGETKVEYYCTQCRVPVCLNCKMAGNHSEGDAATHSLIPLTTAYAHALEGALNTDPEVQQRTEMIDEQLVEVENKLQMVVNSTKEIEEEIMRIANVAITRARALAGEKALLIRSQRTELLRKKEEIITAKKFLATQRANAGPLAFIKINDMHKKYINGLRKTDDIVKDIDAELNIYITGGIEVSTTEKVVERTITVTPEADEEPMKDEQNAAENTEYDEYEEEEETPESAQPEEEEEAPQQEQEPEQEPEPVKPSPKKATVEYASLVDISKKRIVRNTERGLEIKFKPFKGSDILEGDSGMTLYLCFPFKNIPQTHLLFSTERDGRSIKKMHELIDGIGITVVLVKTGEFVFGGFAATKWNSEGKPFGERSSSFLFSITRDAFIPYRPRVADACHLYATEDTLTFGKYDISLAGDFDECSAVLENSYGVGFKQKNNNAATFLAGAPKFAADVVEVWGFFTSDQK